MDGTSEEEMEATGAAAATRPPTEAELRTMSHGQLAKLATHEDLVQLQLSKQEHTQRQPLVTSGAKAHADGSCTPSPRFVGPRSGMQFQLGAHGLGYYSCTRVAQ